MAYKDEYEVGRLHSDPSFHERLRSMFEGDIRLNFHLAPPLLARRNAKGELEKQKYGQAMLVAFKLLARLKGLRGTPFDLFGRTEERQTERALIVEFRQCVERVLTSVTADNHALAVEIARLPEQIKGFGHVKERNLKAVRARWAELMEQWEQVAQPLRRVA
jgi:indolepyruvate ferredoxin oxidoreductase